MNILNFIADWFRKLWKREKETQPIFETPAISGKKHSDVFVAVAVKSNRVCISNKHDDFTAIKEDGKWRQGYPGFDDLMDNFSEVNDFIDIERYSSEAKLALTSFLKQGL